MIEQTFFLITYNDHTLYHAIPDEKYPIIIIDTYVRIPFHPIDKIAEFINKLDLEEDVFLRVYMGHSRILVKELLLDKKKPLMEIIATDMLYLQLTGINVSLPSNKENNINRLSDPPPGYPHINKDNLKDPKKFINELYDDN